MDVLDHFSIPYKGLKNGVHDLTFEIDAQYFAAMDSDLTASKGFVAKLELDKRPDMSVAEFEIKGTLILPCDRCLTEMSFPIDTANTLHIKIGVDDPDQYEVMWIEPETSKISFAQYIYECILLAKPLIVKHEDIKQCDQDVIAKINGEIADVDDNIKEEKSQSNVWGALKDMKFD